MTTNSNVSAAPEKFVFCSSLADDVYHPNPDSTAYEWWYFDAVSDDGRDQIVVIFLDNFVFSPRYNRAAGAVQVQSSKSKVQGSQNENQRTKDEGQRTTDKFPAVAFCYYRDGKPLYRAINEFAPEDFSADTNFPACRIGDSDFQFEATPYGVRYLLTVNANLRGGRRLRAALEWLAVERDFHPIPCAHDLTDSHFWNLAVPRADVTSKIEIFNSQKNQLDKLQFRGTGYHDHNQDRRWLPRVVNEWYWGRAHFVDATAIFYRFHEADQPEAITKLFVVRADKFEQHDAEFKRSEARRHIFGVKYPRALKFDAGANCSLAIKQSKAIDASFFYLRFLSEMQLDLGDGIARRTIGVTEYLKPNSLNWRWLDWLVSMRIGRNGRGAFLP